MQHNVQMCNCRCANIKAYTSARRKLGTTKITLRKVKGHSGHVWNEIADELAAMGRGMADALDASLPEATAELIDRYARAIDGLGGSVQLECNGFDLSGRWGLSEGGMGWWGREGGRQD